MAQQLSNDGYTPIYDESHFERLKLRSKAAWFHPLEDAIYVSDSDKRPTYPEGNKVIPSMAVVRKARQQAMAATSNTELDKATFSIYNKRDGWQNAALEYLDRNYKARTAGNMAPADYSGIEVTNVLANLLGVNERNFVLQGALNTIQTPYLDTALDTWTGFEVSTDLGIGAEIPTNQGTFARQTVTLKMDGAHIAKYDELDMKPRYHDVWRVNLENIGRRMVKAKAQKVATELETASSSAFGDWAAYTTDHFTRSALDDIGTLTDVIISNDGVPGKIAFHSRVFRDFLTNVNSAPPITAAPDGISSTFTQSAQTLQLPKTGLQAYVDNLLTNTSFVVWDPEAVLLFQGPAGTATYRDEHHRAEGYYTKDYNAVKTVQSGKTRKGTGVSA